nr:tripartite tricarboxylate transporter TctB family protein [Ciceribacter sp. S153]
MRRASQPSCTAISIVFWPANRWKIPSSPAAAIKGRISTVTAENHQTDTTHRQLGPFCIIVGAAALWIARDYETGTFVAMGPGFFPKTVSMLLIALGAFILLAGGRDLPADDEQEAPVRGHNIADVLRVIGCVIGSIIIFGLTLKPFGLPIASFLMVVLASFARKRASIAQTLAAAVALAVFATLLFPLALGLQIPVLPEFVR